MDLSLLLDQVIPPDGVLYKHCHGGWDFYKSDYDFVNGKSYLSQKSSEPVHQFFERLVQQLMKDEENDKEPLVTIDYAIWSQYKSPK